MQASLYKFMAMAAAFSAVPFAVRAQNDNEADWNHFSADARLGLNIRAKFTTPGANALPASPAAGGAVNRTYSDGFVDVDITGNQGGLTSNWGYKNAAQALGNSTLQFHASAPDGATSSTSDDPSLGFEFSYVRDMAHAAWGDWGFKFAFGYSRITIQDNQPHTTGVTEITDTYQVPAGVFQLPTAPYSGSFAGPGAVIGSTPTRSTTLIPGGALVTGNRSIDANIFDFHLGPNADVRLSKRLWLQLSGGLAFGVADSRFSYAETTTTAAGAFSAAGSNHDDGLLGGAYAEAGLAYRFWRSASVSAGVEFQYLGRYNQSAAGGTAQLDLSQTIFCKAGLQWSF